MLRKLFDIYNLPEYSFTKNGTYCGTTGLCVHYDNSSFIKEIEKIICNFIEFIIQIKKDIKEKELIKLATLKKLKEAELKIEEEKYNFEASYPHYKDVYLIRQFYMKRFKKVLHYEIRKISNNRLWVRGYEKNKYIGYQIFTINNDKLEYKTLNNNLIG